MVEIRNFTRTGRTFKNWKLNLQDTLDLGPYVKKENGGEDVTIILKLNVN